MIKCGGRRPDERRSDDRTMYRRTDGARPRSSTLPRAVRAAAAQRQAAAAVVPFDVVGV